MEGIPKWKLGHSFSCRPQRCRVFWPFTYDASSSEAGPPQASLTINGFEKRQSALHFHVQAVLTKVAGPSVCPVFTARCMMKVELSDNGNLCESGMASVNTARGKTYKISN